MGIFDEEEKKMADEAERQKAQREGELAQTARNVSQDLMSYIGTHPRPQGPDIDIRVHENRVALRKKTTSKTMEIVCTGRATFEVTMDGATHGQVNQSNMARRVLYWLKH